MANEFPGTGADLVSHQSSVYLQVLLLSIRFCRAKVEIQDYFDYKKNSKFLLSHHFQHTCIIAAQSETQWSFAQHLYTDVF